MHSPVANPRKLLRALLPALTCWLGAPAAFADDDAPAEAQPGFYLAAGYTGDFRRNTTGGLAVGDAYSDSIDLGAEWTTTGLFSDATMTTSVSVMHLSGPGITGKYV